MADDCIFCKIADKTMPSDIVYEDDLVVAFRDIDPQAPVHILVIPKKHISTVLTLTHEDKELVGHMFLVAASLSREQQIAQNGFRLVTNCNKDGGQTVFHLHMHLLGGRSLHWPPG
ncbi:MAG TPA: histidine triad nucleotide-binding protein [Bacillota bacterium]|nr:histidine triad nucleotide-binding protein [Bacillota bacterium]HOA90944.1 histidine triad nucleotide-binding protein [Bacillota bacterium]HOJ45970.1 histidine triad nucleotide-binding protein [Bacillota bacterium]HOL13922.1 histidine triad nucleotide-binding protein [Bacillota bacterium]HOP55069.1 histidine triad nucleotide-binding protein [Bacillota bacterium]